MLRRLLLVYGILSVWVSVGTCLPALAEFKVCNKTNHAAAVAIVHQRRGAWVSEGWWRIEARKCQAILSGQLQGRYYYLRGVHLGVEGDWEGNRHFCVVSKNFTIKGQTDCAKRGYGKAGFFEVDTGDRKEWVQNLSD